jgi:hypothetical protein
MKIECEARLTGLGASTSDGSRARAAFIVVSGPADTNGTVCDLDVELTPEQLDEILSGGGCNGRRWIVTIGLAEPTG